MRRVRLFDKLIAEIAEVLGVPTDAVSIEDVTYANTTLDVLQGQLILMIFVNNRTDDEAMSLLGIDRNKFESTRHDAVHEMARITEDLMSVS